MILSLLVLAASSPGATLASGHHFTCALGDQGSVSCWGANGSGQLGDGSQRAASTPVRVPGVSGAKDLACGAEHVCVVLGTGEVSCWGHNGLGQSGDAIELFVPSPRKVTGLPPVSRVFAGHSTTCAVTTDARLFCWGRNMTSQLGTPRLDDETGRATPTELKELSDVGSAAVGEGHVCALTNKGSVFCWGDNGNARAGGKGPLVATPTRIDVNDGVALAVTNIATFVVRADGSLVWWGSWQRDRDFVAAPSPRAADDRDVTLLFTNRFTAYVRRSANDWAFPKSGVAPLLPAVDLSWAVELVAGDNHACGRARDGKVRCWGWNREGVGTGTTAAVKEPTEVKLGGAAKAAPIRRPERAEACAAVPAKPPPEAPVHPSCGNGRRDVIGMSGGQCAPCMPGRVCPCAPRVEIQEPCDGEDHGSATCATQGYATGALRCTSRCTFDTSGCTPGSTVPPGVTVAWPSVPEAVRPHRGLALAAQGRALGAVWGTAEGCGQAVFAHFTAALALSSSSPPFGRSGVAHAELAATPKGWLVALGDRTGTTWVHDVGANGKPGPERAAFFGRPLFLEAAGPEGPWLLGLSTRGHSYLGGLSVVLLDARGAVLAETVVFSPSAQTSESVESLPPPADQAAAVKVQGGFLVARSQSVPGMARGGVVVARISTSGRVEWKRFVARWASAPFWLSSEDGVRLGWLRNTSPPGQAAHFVAEAVPLDAEGAPQGEAQTLAELDPAEWFFSGALNPGSTELLAPRLDLSGSTLLSGTMTRLDLLEPPRRMTLVEGKGVGQSRLVGWGDVMVAAWVWSRDGATRLGLAKVLPASSR